MNYSIKKNRYFYFVLIIYTFFLNLGCKVNIDDKKESSKLVVNKKEKIKKKYNEIIDSCSLSGKQILIISDKKNQEDVSIIFNSIDTTKNISVRIDKLNFEIHEISRINVNCDDDKFQLIYMEIIGNNSYSTFHVFEKDTVTNVYMWTKVYKIVDTRQEMSVDGAILKKRTSFKYYKAKEDESLTFLPIYSFTGFQEGKESIIDSFYKLFKKENSYDKIELYGHKLVLNFLMGDIILNNENLSKYNDIAYYLEQSKLYEESIFILEKIMQEFPNRTVAYINAGDAYWNNNEKEKAKEAYKTYIKQMKENKKESIIPKRIYERLN